MRHPAATASVHAYGSNASFLCDLYNHFLLDNISLCRKIKINIPSRTLSSLPEENAINVRNSLQHCREFRAGD